MKKLKKYYKLSADPQDVYTSLTNPFTIELWTGEKAIMSEEPNSDFSLWGGDIVGKNLAFEPNKSIQQQWFKLWEVKGGTSVELEQTNIPDEAFENIQDGWDNAYFGAIEKLFEI